MQDRQLSMKPSKDSYSWEESTTQTIQSFDFYHSIAEDANQGIWLLDGEGRTLYANPCMMEMLGYKPGDFTNHSLYDFCFPEDVSFALERINRSLLGEAEKFDCRLRSSDGKLLWTLACTSPLKDPETGEVRGVIGLYSDITNRRIAEIALRESEKRFRAMADTAPIMMWISGRDKLCTYFNKHWLSFTGRSFTQELGNGWTEGIHADDYKMRVQTYVHAFDRRELFEVEYRLKRSDGKYRWVLDRGSPRFTTEGEFMGYIGSCIDISERKENEYKLSQLATIIQSSEDAIYSTDLDGKIKTWNHGAEKVFGYSPSEVIGKTLFQTIVPRIKKNELKQIYKRLKKDEQINSFETTRQQKNGQQIDTLLTVSRIKDEDGKVVGASIIAQDISDRKKAEKERDELLVQLNQLISIAPIGISFVNDKLQYIKINKMLATINNKSVEEHLNKTPSDVLPPYLAKLVTKNIRKVLRTKKVTSIEYEGPEDDAERAHRWWVSTYYPIQLSETKFGVGALVQDITDQKLTDKRKDDFISMASHELKTPVTTIKAFTQILQNIPNIEKDKAQVYLGKISSEVNRLTKLINDFLDISKIRTGRLRIIKESFEFDDLVYEILMGYQQLHKDHTIELKGASNAKIVADRSRIAQVINNILDNAVKYSPNNKKITLHIAVNAEEVTFSVQDRGIGISKENQTRVFQSFYRAFESDESEFPGLGIGLYISSEIIKAHRGVIGVKSKKGHGALFYFSLPIR